MSGEMDGRDFDEGVATVELQLLQGGFEPCIPGVQDGFWVQIDRTYKSPIVYWLPADWLERSPEGWLDEIYSPQEEVLSREMAQAYTRHIAEVAEEEARLTRQRPDEGCNDGYPEDDSREPGEIRRPAD